jgi:hypothetical protein
MDRDGNPPSGRMRHNGEKSLNSQKPLPQQKGREVMMLSPIALLIRRQVKLQQFRTEFLKQQRIYQAALLRGPVVDKQKYTGRGGGHGRGVKH